MPGRRAGTSCWMRMNNQIQGQKARPDVPGCEEPGMTRYGWYRDGMPNANKVLKGFLRAWRCLAQAMAEATFRPPSTRNTPPVT
jgi:hypothetical protein